VDSQGRITQQTIHGTEFEDPGKLLNCLEGVSKSLMDDAAAAIGLGVAGRVDRATASLQWCGRLPLEGFDLAGYMASRLGLPVGIENDGGAAALAEHEFGAGRGAEDMILVAVGTGIGGGLILNNQLFRGSTGYAGELGHIVIDYDGPRCLEGCSGVGHLERMASGTSLDALVREAVRSNPEGDLARAVADGRDASGPLAVALARAGSTEAARLIKQLAESLAFGLVSLINLLNPEVIVIGGGVAEAGELLLAPVRTVVNREAIPAAAAAVRIVGAELGSTACLVGAGLIGLRAAGVLV
jgi:glucokinase